MSSTMMRHISSLLSIAIILGESSAFLHVSKRPKKAVVVIPQLSRTAIRISTTEETDIDSTTNPRKMGLALQLDDGTRKSHSLAENTAFVTGFFIGISKPESYRNLLTSLYYVYQAMEDVMDKTNDEGVKLLDDASLRRVAALEQDMQYFYGNDWKTKLPPPTAATKKYVSRIQQLNSHDYDGDNQDSNQSFLLIAHQYTRYVGDLFGGQMMGNMATRSMKLPRDGSGVAFYKFEEIKDTQSYITDWYRRLNSLNLTDQQKEAIVDEANLVFELNIGILEELEGSPLTAVWSMTISSLKERLGWS